MTACTHHWTVTSECPMCLRAEIERLRAERDALLKDVKARYREIDSLHTRDAQRIAERDALRSAIDQAARILHGDGADDLLAGYYKARLLLDAALAAKGE